MRTFIFLIGVLLAAPSWALPDLGAVDLEGQKVDLADYKGKMIVLNYWATWCPPCREELPELSIFHEAHKETDAVVIGVNFEDISAGKLQEFLDEQLIDYPMLHQKPKQRTPFGLLIGLPTSYIISADQKSIKAHVGPVTRKQLEQYLILFGP